MTTDIVIIGAGAAGIAAARWLQAAGQRPLVLEARNRAGGRAWTDTETFGIPIDMGCAWLHSADRNPWTFYAREHGFSVIERSPVWHQRIGADEATPEHLAAWHAAYGRNEALIAAAAAEGRDVAVSELVPDDRYRPMFDAVMTWLMGADSDRVSNVDYTNYADSELNWPIPSGLGAVVAHAATGLNVRLNSPVREIDSTGRRIRIVTGSAVIEAGAVIITVPTNVLAANVVRFVPDLPAEFSAAFAGLPLGVANKVFLRMAPGTLPYEGSTYFIGTDRSVRTGSYATRPAGQELMLAYFGGRLAIELEQRNELVAFARDQLGRIFGAQFGNNIQRTLATAWSTDPWSRGSYSVALPGQAHQREQLNQPLQDRIFFAGEACSREYFGTVHGAWHSGVSAAKRVLELA